MFLDTKREGEVTIKVDPLSLPALIAWLERQPAQNHYDYGCVGHCLAAQYNQFIGRKYTVKSIYDPESFDVALERIVVSVPFTFGAALDRARNYTPRALHHL
jgi:hypothetical protein